MEFITDGTRHLICKPYSIENLHKMADRLNIKRCWFHNKKNRWHYDIPVTRKKEIEDKCTIVKPVELLKIIIQTVGK